MIVGVILLLGAWGGAAVLFLVNGFRSGSMRCYLGIGTVGQVSREHRPRWFWCYAALNLIVAIACASFIGVVVCNGVMF